MTTRGGGNEEGKRGKKREKEGMTGVLSPKTPVQLICSLFFFSQVKVGVLRLVKMEARVAAQTAQPLNSVSCLSIINS
jgi:hypothetical protein